MIARNATPADIAHVILTMRELSAAEAFASRANDNRHRLAEDVIAAAERAVVMRALVDEFTEPAAIVGLMWTGPGRGGMLFVANEAFPAIVMRAHRWWRREFVPEILTKFRRVEFTGSPPDTASGRWLSWCGFTCEGIARSYGKRGEDFAHWAWVNPRWTATVDAPPARLGSPDHHQAQAGDPPHV